MKKMKNELNEQLHFVFERKRKHVFFFFHPFSFFFVEMEPFDVSLGRIICSSAASWIQTSRQSFHKVLSESLLKQFKAI